MGKGLPIVGALMNPVFVLIALTAGSLTITGCRSSTGTMSGMGVDSFSLDFPHGELRLSFDRSGDTRLFYAALPACRTVRSGAFDVDKVFRRLQPRLHENVPAEERPIGQAYGMVNLGFINGRQEYHLIYDADFAEGLLRTACANLLVFDGHSANDPCAVVVDEHRANDIFARACAKLGDEGRANNGAKSGDTTLDRVMTAGRREPLLCVNTSLPGSLAGQRRHPSPLAKMGHLRRRAQAESVLDYNGNTTGGGDRPPTYSSLPLRRQHRDNESDPALQPIGTILLETSISPPKSAEVRSPVIDSLRDDSRYYDFWPGTWYRIVDGVVDTTSTRFRVEPGVHPAAFEEHWRLVIDSETTITARAFRAWDSASERWRYVWLSDAGQFQVWEGRKVGDHWYLYKEFEIEGRRVLSRQAWIPIAPGRLERISEHSSDGGRTWQRRFREEYARVSTAERKSRHDRRRSPRSP